MTTGGFSIITAVVPFEMVTVMVVGVDTVVMVEISVVIPMQVFGGSGSIQTIPAAKNNTSRESITTTERQGESYMNDIATF